MVSGDQRGFEAQDYQCAPREGMEPEVTWCTECNSPPKPDLVDPTTGTVIESGCESAHKQQIVEIRYDIFQDAMARLIKDLRRTGRL
jgi:hypothetical protein